MRELGDWFADRMVSLIWWFPGDLPKLIPHGLLVEFGRSGFNLLCIK